MDAVGPRERKQFVYDALNALGIPYEVTEHPAAFTVEEIDGLNLPHGELIAKNLFLRDDKGRRHFLLVLRKEKRADLKAVAAAVGLGRLGFASEERLERFLGLKKGSVSPLGVLNDGARCVEVLLDVDLQELPGIMVHPNDNTASVLLRVEDLERLIRAHGSRVTWITV